VQAVSYRTSGNHGAWETGDTTDALTTSTDPNSHVLAFSCKDHGADATNNLAPTLRSMGHDASHANAGGQLAVAFDLRGREGGAQFEGPHDTANIRAASGGSSRSYVVQQWVVRRLTPEECERLQGFPDGYTSSYGQADGPRYKQLGNSWAVPCISWIGERLASAMREIAA
jgi:DNA (cytosine-5)-methyltransferase 1